MALRCPKYNFEGWYERLINQQGRLNGYPNAYNLWDNDSNLVPVLENLERTTGALYNALSSIPGVNPNVPATKHTPPRSRRAR